MTDLAQRGVWLNSVFYPIIGEVTKRRSTPFAAQITSGGQTVTDYRPLNTWQIGPLKGGMGQEKWEPGTDDRYWYADNIDTSRNLMTSGPLVATLDTGGSFGTAPLKIIYSQAKIFGIGHQEIAYANAGGWTTAEPGTPIDNPTDAIVYYDTTNTECLLVASAADGIQETHDAGSNWVKEVSNDRAYMAVFENRVCAIANANTGFDYSAVGDIRTAWTTPSPSFPLLPYPATGLIMAKDRNDDPALYALTTGGLFMLDVYDNFFVYDDTPWARDSTAGNCALFFQDNLYVAGGGGRIVKIRGDSVTEFGPDIDDGLPETLQGDVTDMVGAGYWIIIAVDGGASNKSCILKRHTNKGAWQVVYVAAATNKRIRALCWDDGTLYFGYHTDICSLPLSSKTDNYKHLSTHTYAASGDLYTSWFSSPFESMKKVAHELHCISQDMDADELVTVYYRIDDNTSWIQTGLSASGVFNDSPRDTPITFGTNAVGLEFERIQFKFSFARGSTTTNSPKVERFELKYRVIPPMLWGWSFVVNARKYGDKSGASMIDDLETAAGTATLLAFYPTGSQGDTAKYVQVVGGINAEIGTEQGREGNYRVNVEQVIAA